MKTVNTFILFLCIAGLASAQNLVLNPGFEEFDRCPSTQGYFNGYVNDWRAVGGTPDCYDIDCWQPSSRYIPRNGKGMAAFYVYGSDTWAGQLFYAREYIEGQLSAPLEKGKTYTIEFWVKPFSYVSDSEESFGIENVGIYFGNQAFAGSADSVNMIRLPAQFVHQNGVITDTEEYTKISGCYTAKGGEQYMMFGNFEDDDNTHVEELSTPPPWGTIYWRGLLMIDDVALRPVKTPLLWKDSMICMGEGLVPEVDQEDFDRFRWADGNFDVFREIKEAGEYILMANYKGCPTVDTLSVATMNCEECRIYIPNSFSPNDDGINDKFEIFPACELLDVELQLFDRWGNQLFHSNDLNDKWDGYSKGQRANNGVYIYAFRYSYLQSGVRIEEEQYGTLTIVR